jgi:hypothetical protein
MRRNRDVVDDRNGETESGRRDRRHSMRDGEDMRERKSDGPGGVECNAEDSGEAE